MQKKRIIYLCGGIAGLSDAQCKDWREHVKLKLSNLGKDYDFLDPMRRDYRGVEGDNTDDIVELDKVDIDNSDILIVNAVRPSWGTAMEVMYSYDRGKIIYSVCDSPTPSPWLVYHSNKIFKTFGELIDYLSNVCVNNTI